MLQKPCEFAKVERSKLSGKLSVSPICKTGTERHGGNFRRRKVGKEASRGKISILFRSYYTGVCAKFSRSSSNIEHGVIRATDERISHTNVSRFDNFPRERNGKSRSSKNSITKLI